MNELGKGFDGTIEKAISSTEKLKGLPGIVQKYMMWGDYKSGLVSKIDGSNFGTDENGKDIQNYVAQISNLDKAQRNAIISVTELGKESKNTIKTLNALIEATQNGSRINGKVFEASLKSAGNSEINQGDINSLMNALGMKNGDNYALPNTNEVKKNLNMWAKAAENADAKTRLMNAGIIESTKNGYAMTDSFKKMIGIEEVDGVVKTGLTAKQLALNTAMQIGKQLALSFGVAIATWAISKAVEYLMNLKTRSEELVATMNDSHDAAEQATKDVEEIQSKIDELNNSLEAAGVKKIEDIVDPTERERLQTINDMLQAQLELKKQLEKDANDKANTDTSAVVNDKTEDSIVKSRTVNVSYAEGGANAGTHQVAEKVSKTESLNEHSDYLDQLVQKRREMAAAGEEETQAYKDNEVEIEKEKTKIEELSSAVSEQMSNYSTDADNFDQYKDEYVTGTNAMTVATKALANAQDSTGIDTTNLDIFSEKVKQIKNDIDNGDSQQSDWKTFNGLDAFSGMTGEAIINIDKDSSHQTEAETAALEKLHKTADENKISFESLIGVFESFGLVQISNSATADDYADKLEKTMGVIDNIQSAYKACSNAVEEYNKYGYMSIDSLQALLQMDDQYLNTLELVNGKLQVNQSAYADLLATQYAEAQMEAISQATSELYTIAKGDSAEKAETFTEATEDEKNKLAALCPALKDATIGTGELAAALAAAQSAGEGGNADAVQAKIDGVMNALNTRLTLIKTNMQSAMSGASALKNQMNGFDTGKKTQKAASSITDLASAFDTLKEAMNEYNKYGYLSYDTTKSLVGLEDVYTECLTKNNGKLEINTAKLRKFIKTQLEAANASDDGGKSAAEMTKILNWLNSSVDSETISFNQLTDAIKGYGTALDEATGKTDEFQSGMQTLHELFTIDHANGDQIVDYDTLKKVTDLIAKHPEISLTGCTNLEEFYAGGSGITGVAFAKGGKINKAELPAIASLSAKNLNYLTDLKITAYKNITTLTVENCPTIDLVEILAKCTSLNRVRLTGVKWELDDTSLLDRLLKMTGLDENGYNTDHSVIEGSVHVPIMRERQLEEFTAQWPDLNITYNTLVQQFVWTFVNKDGTVLDVQYIDKGDKAVDPVTRKENPIPTPTAESTVSTDFTFSGWDTEFTTVFSNQTVTATYTESVRKYTVRYMNRGAVLKETIAPYGSMVLYDGDIPTYTSEETAFKYYLFSGWDKGGYVSGDKDINAVYDSCEYSSTYFDGKEIGQLRPVEIYAMSKVGVEQKIAEVKDEVSIKLGNDFSYEDITEKILIGEPQVFDGKTYIDTDIKLFEEDRDFVLAVDYNGNAKITLDGVKQSSVSIKGTGITTVMTDENGGLVVNTGDPSAYIEALTNSEIDKILST